MHGLPPVTISMISLNDEAIISKCLQSIRDQDYPQDKLFIQLFDGGSTDGTVEIAKSYGAKVILNPELKDNPAKRGSMALLQGNTELRLYFSADNRFGSKTTLKKMVEAQLKYDPLGVITQRYQCEANSSPLSRYFSLIGGTDPLVVFLRLNDRCAFDSSVCQGLGNIVSQDQDACLLHFSKSAKKFPTLGANGFLYKISDYRGSRYARKALHIDMCFEANLRSSRGFCVVLNETINHEISIPLFKFLKRRITFAKLYKYEPGVRNYEIYNSETRLRCILFAFYSLIMVPHLLRSIKGFSHKPDWAWFLHPLICLAYSLGYGHLFLEKHILGK